MNYGNTTTVTAPFADTVQRVRDELKAEGFGVLTEIDVTTTLREKLRYPRGLQPATRPPSHRARPQYRAVASVQRRRSRRRDRDGRRGARPAGHGQRL